MRIQYLAHASFLITTSAGTRIVTDPFDPKIYTQELYYREFNEPADIVTISHEHGDHCGIRVVKGSPVVIKGNGKFIADKVEFLGVATYHDESHGEQRGKNTVFVIRVDGLRIAHLGDLGHVLTADQAVEIGAVDVAFIPVGGYYTIDVAKAEKVSEQLKAKIVIPMHYKTDRIELPIVGVDEFTRGKDNVIYKDDSILDVTAGSMPDIRQIVVLKPALGSDG